MFWDKFVSLCNKKGVSPNGVAKELGFSTGTVTWWKKGRMPRDTALQKLSDYFGVTVDYLLNEETEKKASPSEEGEDVVVVSRNGDRFVHHLSPDQMNLIENMIAQFDKNKK